MRFFCHQITLSFVSVRQILPCNEMHEVIFLLSISVFNQIQNVNVYMGWCVHVIQLSPSIQSKNGVKSSISFRTIRYVQCIAPT